MRILSWNVNGIRAVERKGFLDWLKDDSPDVLALQETKAMPEQLSQQLREPEGYHSYFNSAQRKGYSGVAVYTKEEPESVICGLGEERFDSEGRTLILEYPKFVLFNIYFPNGKMNPQRLDFKLDFYDKFLKVCLNTAKRKKKAVIVCGDVNTAHKEIDLARPKENSMVSGFLPQEREWIDRFTEKGLVDTFRQFNKEPGRYSWWDFKSKAKERNVGWRIDYFFIDKAHVSMLKDAFILKDVYGSDHCPVGIEIDTSIQD